MEGEIENQGVRKKHANIHEEELLHTSVMLKDIQFMFELFFFFFFFLQLQIDD